jgi:type IV pilus assembly protein PilA
MFKKALKNEKGLTLIELLAVIVILAIIAAIAIPAIGNIINNSKVDAVKSEAIQILNGAKLYYTANDKATEAGPTELKDYVEDTGGKISDYTITFKEGVAYISTKGEIEGLTFANATIKNINEFDEKTGTIGDQSSGGGSVTP